MSGYLQDIISNIGILFSCASKKLDYTIPAPKEPRDSQTGTVRCVAVDNAGDLAAATSTGGHVNKMVGRVGDTPLIDAGTYANNFCAISTTGKKEEIIHGTVAKEMAALMEYKGLSLAEAMAYAVDQSGLIAVSANGEVNMPFNSTGMFRSGINN